MTTQEDVARLARRRTFVLKVLATIGASYAVDALLLGLYAWLGTISQAVPAFYLVAGVAHIAAFAVVVNSRHFEHATDYYFSVWQILTASAIQLGFLAIAPSMALVFFTVLFVVFGLGALSQSLRQSIITMVLISVGVAVELLIFGVKPEVPAATLAERSLIWLVFVAALSRLVLVGLYANAFRKRMDKKNRELSASMLENHRLATTDDLTAVLNRRSLMTLLAVETERATRYKQPFCVALLDLDHFKTVNDRYGHMVGDRVLAAFAAVAREAIRTTDQLGRLGGEEFLIVLTNTDGAEALDALERLRKAVLDYDWNSITPGLTLTVSGGAAVFQVGDALDQLLSRADVALYAAKRAGRNCMRLARFRELEISEPQRSN